MDGVAAVAVRHASIERWNGSFLFESQFESLFVTEFDPIELWGTHIPFVDPFSYDDRTFRTDTLALHRLWTAPHSRVCVSASHCWRVSPAQPHIHDSKTRMIPTNSKIPTTTKNRCCPNVSCNLRPSPSTRSRILQRLWRSEWGWAQTRRSISFNNVVPRRRARPRCCRPSSASHQRLSEIYGLGGRGLTTPDPSGLGLNEVWLSCQPWLGGACAKQWRLKTCAIGWLSAFLSWHSWSPKSSAWRTPFFNSQALPYE